MDDTDKIHDKCKDPITMDDMRDPVLASDGHTYEWASLAEWVASKDHRTSPITREVLRPLVYVNKAMCQALSIVPKTPFTRKLYTEVNVSKISIPLHGKNAQTPWIVCLLTQLECRRKSLALEVQAMKGSKPRWTVVGPPVAYPFQEKLMEWVTDFGLETFFENPLCLSTSTFFIEGHPVTSLEVLCGVDDS